MESRAMELGRWIAVAVLALLVFVGVRTARAEVSADQPAAVVFFPKLAVDSSIGVDTLVRLSNTSTKDPLTLHCFLVDASPLCPNDVTRTCLPDSLAPKCTVPCVDRWNETDFRLILTVKQPVGWLISQGMRDCRSNPPTDPNRPCFQLDGLTRVGPGNQSNAGSNILPAPHDQFVGYLQCIAVDDTDAPVERNDLKGEATIVRSAQSAAGGKACNGGRTGASCATDADCTASSPPCMSFVPGGTGVCTGSGGIVCQQDTDCPTETGKCVPADQVAGTVDVDGYNGIGLQAITGKNNHDGNLCLGGCTPGQGTCRVTRSQSCFKDSDCPANETCVGKCPTNTLCPVGPEYDGCANILLLDHFFDGATDPISADSVVTNLTLVPCSQDYLRQNPQKTTVQFLVFNEFEQRFSTSTPVKCFKEFRLSNIDTSTNIKSIFSAAVNGTLTGQTRIRGVAIDDPSHGDALMGVAREFRCGPGSTLANCNAVSTSAFNLHSQGRRPEADIIYLP